MITKDLAAACERARLFLATLDYLSLEEGRQASELRHCLRGPSTDAAKAAIRFLSGVSPARKGQAEVLDGLQMTVCRAMLMSFAGLSAMCDRAFVPYDLVERLREIKHMDRRHER